MVYYTYHKESPSRRSDRGTHLSSEERTRPCINKYWCYSIGVTPIVNDGGISYSYRGIRGCS